jgi:hypothetical protein
MLLAVVMACILFAACSVPSSEKEAREAGWHELRKLCRKEHLDPNEFHLLEVAEHELGWTVEFESASGSPKRVQFLFQRNGFVNTSVRNE